MSNPRRGSHPEPESAAADGPGSATESRSAEAAEGSGPEIWRDPRVEADVRLDALLTELTLDEKLAQLGSVWLGFDATGGVAPLQNVFSPEVSWPEVARHGIGQLTRVFGTRPVTASEGNRRLRELQRTLREETRLGIPALVHEECLTGFTTLGASVFPTALAWAATFDPELVREMAAAIGRDLAMVGVHQGLSPVLDVVRDHRWGRVEETLGEDPYLVAQLGTSYVRGLQEQGVIATLKHFAGYAWSRGARNHAPVSAGPREIAEYVLPPFEHAVRIGHVGSVMNSYTDVDGVPAAADRELLTALLRETWGFTGTVVSDYGAVKFLQTEHRVARTEGQAAVAALDAGLDVELPATLCFGEPLRAELESGRVDPEVVDRAVRRVLRQKLELGLLDRDWRPVEVLESIDLDPAGNRDIARRLAEQSVILVENDGILPIRPTGRVAVVGPGADDVFVLFGCYAFPNHVLARDDAFDGDIGIAAPTVLEALRTELTEAELSHRAGCAVTGGDTSGFDEAAAAVVDADLAIVVVGDRAGLFGHGTSGEGCDAADLQLPGLQHELVERLLATGTPMVLVCISGRPYALGQYAGRARAIVQAFFPGEEGAGAIARVLTGQVNPSGKLPVEIARRPGGQPRTYLAPRLGQHNPAVSDLDPTPAYAFGHGLSYTTYTYGPLSVDRTDVDTSGRLAVSVAVRNSGGRAGHEVVQLYACDPVAAVTRPVTQLIGFAKVALDAGAEASVRFEVHTDRLSYVDRELRRIVEPGDIEFRVGTAAETFAGPVVVQLTGPIRPVCGQRVMDTPVTIRRSPTTDAAAHDRQAALTGP